MRKRFDRVYKECERYGQSHLLKFYDELTPSQQDSLLGQIENIDFPLMQKLYAEARREEAEGIHEEGVITPIDVTVLDSVSGATLKQYHAIGIESMKQGQYAAVTMAGGQGTRLGHDGPKGTFDLGLPNAHSLFSIQAMRLKAKYDELGVYIPWYIMTSRENDAATKAFFEETDFFGYDRDSVMFFTQCMLPMLFADTGRIVLEEKWKIKEGADGHGGIFRAMQLSGVYDDMVARGVKWVFIGGIDNALVRLCDPVFLGFMHSTGRLIGGKSLIKCSPREKIGVFCRKDGKPYVIEYTEISDEMAEAVNEDGDYLYGDGHILVNMFSTQALSELLGRGLPYHKAFKKAPYVGDDGEKVIPSSPNAYKFEAFIFDAFGYFDDMSILRISREKEFAPIKNKEGEDSPDTARALFLGCGEDIY